MKLVEVKEIPRRKDKHNLQGMIKEFVESAYMAVMVDVGEDEYANHHSFDNAIRLAVKRSGYAIQVHSICGTLYLVKI